MDNTYTSTYQGDYLTLTYKKRIIQKDYEEDRTTTYNRTAQPSRAREPHCRATQPLLRRAPPCARLLLLAVPLPPGTSKTRCCWTPPALGGPADCREMEKETLRTVLGRVPTIKVQYTFTAADGAKRERSDILTNNLVSRGDPL
jgi:hypothetical protein